MDTCVIPLRHGGLSLVQTTDYIYPIVDDPYMMVSCLLLLIYQSDGDFDRFFWMCSASCLVNCIRSLS